MKELQLKKDNQIFSRFEFNEDGTEIQSGKIEGLSLNPGESKVIEIPFAEIESQGNSEYWLNLSIRLKEDKLWAKAGHELAKQQLKDSKL